MNFLSQISHDIFNLVYPNICQACGDELVGNENMICITCWQTMPRTNFHLQQTNPVKEKLLERVPISNAISMYYFNKDTRIQNCLHAIKYGEKKEIGIELGKRYGNELTSSEWMNEIDVLIPIPLSKQKLKSRGYNQSEVIALGLNSELNIPLDIQSIIRRKNTQSQTTMTIAERLENVKDAFEIKNPSHIEGKHVLLIDDVFTTGATLSSCANEIFKVPNTKVSILTLAYAIV